MHAARAARLYLLIRPIVFLVCHLVREVVAVVDARDISNLQMTVGFRRTVQQVLFCAEYFPFYTSEATEKR